MATDFSAVGRRSKGKGKYGERRTAKLLTDFTGKNYRRTPCSGGFGKQGLIVAEHVFTGDVICDDPGFKFCIESKNRPDSFSLAQLLVVPDKAPFTDWWHYAIEDAKSVNLETMLFFKIGKTSTATVGSEFVALTAEGVQILQYPSDAPKAVFNIYSEPVTFKSSKTKEYVTVKLPNPIIINWRLITNHVDSTTMFK